jgi:MFS family permease
VALPYQTFVVTGSAFLTGLIGAAEIGPLAIGSLYGGALADRFDRRRSGSSSSWRPRPPAPRPSSG